MACSTACHQPLWRPCLRQPGPGRPRIDDLPRRPGVHGQAAGLRTVQRGPLMLVYLTDVCGERVVIIQVNRLG